MKLADGHNTRISSFDKACFAAQAQAEIGAIVDTVPASISVPGPWDFAGRAL